MSLGIGERLRSLRKAKGWKQKFVAAQLGISAPTLSGYESNYRDPDTETVIKLAKLYETSIDFLMTGCAQDRGILVPLVETMRASPPMGIIEEASGFELADRELVRNQTCFALRVKGDNMIGDHIYDGDRIIVIAQPEVKTTDIAVVAVRDEEATLQRIKRRHDICILSPSNPLMEPKIESARDVKVLGKVVEVRRIFH